MKRRDNREGGVVLVDRNKKEGAEGNLWTKEREPHGRGKGKKSKGKGDSEEEGERKEMTKDLLRQEGRRREEKGKGDEGIEGERQRKEVRDRQNRNRKRR